jgi:hypothetical protein
MEIIPTETSNGLQALDSVDIGAPRIQGKAER